MSTDKLLPIPKSLQEEFDEAIAQAGSGKGIGAMVYEFQ
jgi:hypothetical protein